MARRSIEAHRGCGAVHQRRPAVAPLLDEDEDIDDVAILIDGTPERVPPSLDGDEDLVQVPGVAQPALSTLEPAIVYGVE